jgi:hypothetical protein
VIPLTVLKWEKMLSRQSLLDPKNTAGPPSPPLPTTPATNTTNTSPPHSKSHLSSASKAGVSIGVLLGIGALAGSMFLLWWIRRKNTAASTSFSLEAAHEQNRRRLSVQELDGRILENASFNVVQVYGTSLAQSSRSEFEKWAVELDGTGVQ